jgi:hypothetical protein
MGGKWVVVVVVIIITAFHNANIALFLVPFEQYPTQFLVITICFTYAIITPVILPVGAIYFFFALLVYKKQALYVYTPTYDSGGLLFPQSVSKTLFALLISQLTFIGYTLIRKGVYQVCLPDI